MADRRKVLLSELMIVGVVAGAFPILHPGYIKLFKECKTRCEHLLVFLQDNPALERPAKNPPIFTLNERKDLLLSLIYVDQVKEYSTEEDLYSLLQQENPDVRFLGEDYKHSIFTGDNLDIPIHWVSRSHGWSTTKVINSLLNFQRHGQRSL